MAEFILLSPNGSLMSPSSGIVLSLTLRQKTIRVRFIEPRVDNEGLPAQITLSYLQGLQSYKGGYGTWTQVDEDTFDWHYSGTDWSGDSQLKTPLGKDTSFLSPASGTDKSLLAFYKFDILDADLTGVTNSSFLFAQCSIVHCYSFRNTDDVTNAYAMFNGRNSAENDTMVSMCDLSFPSVVGTSYTGGSTAKTNGARQFLSNQANLVSVGNIDLRNCVNCYQTFYRDTALEHIGNLDLRSAGYVNRVFDSASTALTNLASVGNLNISSAISAANMFKACSSLASVGTITTSSSLSATNYMFSGCTSLASAPVPTVMSGVSNMSYMYSGCSGLTAVPLIDTSAATNTSHMFDGCTAVESGALALYTQASTQTTPPSTYNDMFASCGSGTVTGAAELAQIPASWGGTMA